MTIEERVMKVVMAAQLVNDSSKIKPDSRFKEDLGADSLDAIELIMAFEDEFELDIPDEEGDKITTVQGAIDYIKSKMPK